MARDPRVISRLTGLDVNGLSTRQLKTNLQTAIDRLQVETEEVKALKTNTDRLSRSLKTAETQRDRFKADGDTLRDRLRARDASLGELRATIEELKATNAALSERLQRQRPPGAGGGRKRVPTKDLLGAFARDLDAAATETAAKGFEVDDVDVVVTGGVSMDASGAATLDFDDAETANREQSASIRFTLRRKNRVTRLED